MEHGERQLAGSSWQLCDKLPETSSGRAGQAGRINLELGTRHRGMTRRHCGFKIDEVSVFRFRFSVCFS
jgi:hypothetical protein